MKAMIRSYSHIVVHKVKQTKKITLVVVLIIAGLKAFAGGQDHKAQFNVKVNFGCDAKNADLSKDTINFKLIETLLIAKVNELAKNKKFLIRFVNENKELEVIAATEFKPELFLTISILFGNDQSKRGAEVFYADDNDYAFQSIKYANMLLSEVKSSKLNLKINGMNESDLSTLKNAKGPALQLDINLFDQGDDKLILLQEEKLNVLAKLIYECIERISKS